MLVDITSLLEKIATDNIDIESIFWKLSPIELEVLALGCSLDTAIESLSLELKLDSLARAELSEFDRKLLARHGDSCIRVEWMDWEGSSYVQKSQQFIGH